MTSQQTTNHPDANLHPVATGPAAHTVAAHTSPAPLTLYAGWFCPFVQRVWLALEEKKIPYQYIEVNPYHKPASLLQLNPRGLVPTLEHDGRPLYESNVVLEFLEDVYPDHAPSFRPSDPYLRARGRIWSDFVTSRIVPSYHRFLQYQPPEGSSAEEAGAGLDRVRKELLGRLKEFAKEMDGEGPWFFGQEPSLVDLVLAPWVVRLWVFDHWKGGLGIPGEGQGGEDEGVWARWRKWAKAVEERKSVRETMSDKEHYMPIYQRYADNKAMSEMAKATREGRPVP
ncbi:glutathione S-transferase [Viridothelium virens]|uniref:Glutathione S-transferase n=1 Tax=Viridothelium virens TaxID=1048519 RepID=A0A6A6H8E8_VIRVR|nr:glutathione S-transferase [Viridothelium virens]